MKFNAVRVVTVLVAACVTVLFLGAYALTASYIYLLPSLPTVEAMRTGTLPVPLQILTRSGDLIAQIGEKRRVLVRYDDIPLLVNYFLKKFAQAQGRPPKSIATATVETLERFHWPGNVRELENMIQRAIVMAKGDVLLPGDLPPLISSAPASAIGNALAPPAPLAAPESKPADMAALSRVFFQWARENPKLKILPAVERELIIQALLETKGNQVRAAKLLGISRAKLARQLNGHGDGCRASG